MMQWASDHFRKKTNVFILVFIFSRLLTTMACDHTWPINSQLMLVDFINAPPLYSCFLNNPLETSALIHLFSTNIISAGCKSHDMMFSKKACLHGKHTNTWLSQMHYKDYWTGGLNKRSKDYLSGKEEKSFKAVLKIEWNFVKCLSDWNSTSGKTKTLSKQHEV